MIAKKAKPARPVARQALRKLGLPRKRAGIRKPVSKPATKKKPLRKSRHRAQCRIDPVSQAIEEFLDFLDGAIDFLKRLDREMEAASPKKRRKPRKDKGSKKPVF